MKFSIRDLLLVTVIVALAVGWWVDHRRQTQELKRARLQAVGRLQGGLWLAESVESNPSFPAPSPPKDNRP